MARSSSRLRSIRKRPDWVSASDNGPLRVWDPQTGQTLVAFHEDAGLGCVAAGLGSGNLVAGDSEGQLGFDDALAFERSERG